MSNQQKSYSYHYLTLTGEGDAHQLVKDYHLTRATAWNQGEVGEDRYQFQQMCIRFCEHQEENLYWNEAIERFLACPYQRSLFLVPLQFERTLHLVTHGEGFQGYGFHLNESNIQQLAQHHANFQYYAYKQPDDGHDFPYSQILPVAENERTANEYAYFIIESTGHSTEQLSAITGLSPNARSRSQGDIWFPKQPVAEGQQPRRLPTTHLKVDSGIEKGQPLAVHIEAILSQLMPRYEQFIPLLLDYRVSFSLVGTGYLAMPYQFSLSKESILQLAQFKCSVDMDLYTP